jgi:hypothetical protein
MKRKVYGRKATVLAGLILIATVYCAVVFRGHTFTGHRHVDGILGIVIGLYICSHPAANVIDLLFYRRTSLRQPTSGWSGAGWLSLNSLALLMGWFMITVGVARLAIGPVRI